MCSGTLSISDGVVGRQAADDAGLPSVVSAIVRKNEIDGATALSLEPADIDELADASLDRKKLQAALSRTGPKTGPEAQATGPPAGASMPVTRHMESIKRYFCFLCHFKQECGAEVHAVLRRLLRASRAHLLPCIRLRRPLA